MQAANALHQTTQLLRNFAEKTALPNHGFPKLSAIQKFSFPTVPVPQATVPDMLMLKNINYVKITLRKMKREGLRNFMLVSDFDQTLTKSVHEGKRVQASFAVMKEAALISEEIRNNMEMEFKQYRANDSIMNGDKRVKAVYMQKLIENVIQHILSGNLRQDIMNNIMRDAYIVPRARLDTFLQLCAKSNLPFYTISAGISNIIVSVLSHYIDLEAYPNFNVYANEMIFNEQGHLDEFAKPYIHSYLKNNIFNKSKIYPKNILLMGDLLHDVFAVRNIQSKTVVNIGFLNYRTGYSMDAVVTEYIRKFDVVIVTDESLAFPELIIKYLMDLESEQTLFNYIEKHMCTLKDARPYISEKIQQRSDAELKLSI